MIMEPILALKDQIEVDTMFENSDGFIRLQRAYREAAPDSFALFLGAGVNLPIREKQPRYKTYS